MPTSAKYKWLTALVILLIIANAITIGLFWTGGRDQPPHDPGGPASYLVKELKMDTQQERQYRQLITEHQQGVDLLRKKIRVEKDSFFALLKQPAAPDSIKKAAATAANRSMAALDLLTFDHFQKVRALCRPGQQQKFDAIIEEVLAMMGGPKPGGPGGPPPNGPAPDRPVANDTAAGKKLLSDTSRRPPPPASRRPPTDRPPPPGDFPPDGPPPGHPPPHGDRPPPPEGQGRPPGEHRPPPPRE